MKLRLATRGSALARAQADAVARELAALGHDIAIVVIKTAGDRLHDRRFAEVGEYGVFVRDIEAALRAGEADLAVHSYKDLPSRGPDDLVVAAVPERLDAADMLVAPPNAMNPDSVPLPLREGASVGTASTRRQALVRALRPDLSVEFLRGNVITRLRALTEGRFDGIILAAAGLMRLERAANGATAGSATAGLVCTRLDPGVFVPAPAQGAIAIQVRRDGTAVRAVVSQLNRFGESRPLRAERAVLAMAEAGCSTAFGAWCRESTDGLLTLIAILEHNGCLARAISIGNDPAVVAEGAWRALTTRQTN